MKRSLAGVLLSVQLLLVVYDLAFDLILSTANVYRLPYRCIIINSTLYSISTRLLLLGKRPCLEKVIGEILGSEAKNEIQQIPLSNDTMKRRIDVMSIDSYKQVCSEIKRKHCKG